MAWPRTPSIDRLGRKTIRRVVLPWFAVAAVLLGCTGGPDVAAPAITLDSPATQQVTYYPWADAAIPTTDLTLIGHAEGDLGSLVTDDAAYSIGAADPALYLALAVDPGRYEEWVSQARSEDSEFTPPANPPTYEIWTSDQDRLSAPDAVCAYFDPRSDRFTPPECQSSPSVTLDGVVYRAIVEEQSKKLVSIYTFAASDLEAIGTLSDIDERLNEMGTVDPAAYAIAGIDPAQALAVLVGIGNGSDQVQYVFVADGADPPIGLCAYVSPESLDLAAEMGLTRCEAVPAASGD